MHPVGFTVEIEACISDLTENLRYKDRSANDVQENNYCLLCEPYEVHKYTVWAKWAICES
jgi:hypothetical protein